MSEDDKKEMPELPEMPSVPLREIWLTGKSCTVVIRSTFSNDTIEVQRLLDQALCTVLRYENDDLKDDFVLRLKELNKQDMEIK